MQIAYPSILLSLIVLIPCAFMSFTTPTHDAAWRCSIMSTCCQRPKGKSAPLAVLLTTNDTGRARRSCLRSCDQSFQLASALPSDKVCCGVKNGRVDASVKRTATYDLGVRDPAEGKPSEFAASSSL